ncbi:MAG: nucleotidyl transferase AbiEii/AbiGii toxin family protein [Candidatus Obscuribacterales bacterium]|nr:nucleotidyl transferase AbiEii/AbiGii toxin family protein [Candidatus Obscuribacterales bacterium]
MIPQALLTYWRANHAPWTGDDQVEQDLVISRALVDLYSDKLIADSLAFRGGTALNKLFLPTMSRYSEDIDLVQGTDWTRNDSNTRRAQMAWKASIQTIRRKSDLLLLVSG